MINLTDKKYSIEDQKPYPTHELINRCISDYDIYKYYINGFELRRAISSPFREDKNPSFSIYPSTKYKGLLLWKDLSTGEYGDAITLVKKIFNISYNEALSKIVVDFRLRDFKTNDKIIASPIKPVITKDKNIIDISERVIKITTRKWNKSDKEYWSSYGITRKTLDLYNVVPIKYLFINNNIFSVDKNAYAYIENKDGLTRYKIYQPYNTVTKWLNNFIEGTISGFIQLPQQGELLLIASSLKDGMCLHEMGYNFIAPQTENYIFKPHIIQDLIGRFKNIIVFYDYDDAGLRAAKKMKDIYGFNYITTDSYIKDISDYYKYNGKKQTIKLVKECIAQYTI